MKIQFHINGGQGALRIENAPLVMLSEAENAAFVQEFQRRINAHASFHGVQLKTGILTLDAGVEVSTKGCYLNCLGLRIMLPRSAWPAEARLKSACYSIQEAIGEIHAAGKSVNITCDYPGQVFEGQGLSLPPANSCQVQAL